MIGWAAFPIFISFAVTYALLPRWIKVAHKVGLVGEDMNKLNRPKVAELGGVAVVAGFLAGALSYVALNTFLLSQVRYNLYVFAATTTVLIIALVGLMDDVLGWKMGLSKLQKPLLTLPASLPMVVVNAGRSTIDVPLLGHVDLGLAYPLVAVPIGIVGASNAFNMLAGYNGLEAGMGVIILGALSYAAYVTGSQWVAVVGLAMAASLVAFLRFNWFPARVFPGNTLTYAVGALMACLAILANEERLALMLFAPYYLDFLLPLMKGMEVEAYAKVNDDSSLEMPYERAYDVTHLAIRILKVFKRRVYERDVVVSILAFEAAVALAALKLFLA